jgi:hypothetical protein
MKNKNQTKKELNKIPYMIVFAFLLITLLPLVSAETTNSTYVAGTGEAIVYLGLNGVLLIFLIICFVIFLNFNSLLSRVSSFGMGYLLIISISFVSWQMANDFLTSEFLIAIFRIIFLILMIGAFPLLIGAFAWYIYMLTQINEIKRLMSKGFSEDEASRRVR